MNLSNLKPGQIAIVDRIVNGKYGQALAQRLEAMGIVSDRPVQVLREAKFGGPLQIRVGSTTEIAIRQHEAEMILVKTDQHNLYNFPQDVETTSDSTPELSNKVKTASLVSITAIVLVAIAGFYRIVMTRNINPVDGKIVANNVVYKSKSQPSLEEKTKIIGSNKTVPKVAQNAESVNKKSDSLEKTTTANNETAIAPLTNNQNTSISVGAKNNSNQENIESKSAKISDKNQLSELKQKLYNTIDKTWEKPVNATTIYLVKVDQNGAIASYQPLNQVASDNIKNTPLPSLVNSDNATKTEQPQMEWAEFIILFYDNGILEVQPK